MRRPGRLKFTMGGILSCNCASAEKGKLKMKGIYVMYCKYSRWITNKQSHVIIPFELSTRTSPTKKLHLPSATQTPSK